MTEVEKIWTEKVKAVCVERGLSIMAYDGADRTVSIIDEPTHFRPLPAAPGGEG